MNQTKTYALEMEPPLPIACACLLACSIALIAMLFPSAAHAQTLLPFHYIFNSSGTLYEASSAAKSSSPYFWLKSGAKLIINDGRGATIQGALLATDPYYATYALKAGNVSDKGTHPQNAFQLLSRDLFKDVSVQMYVDRTADNLSNTANAQPYIGESLIARYQDNNNYYYAGIRADGFVVIKKKVNGTYATLATKKILPGTYNQSSNPDLMPLNTWMGLKFTAVNNADGIPKLTLSTDIGWTGVWEQALSITDSKGVSLPDAGLLGIISDYGDARFDNFTITEESSTTSAADPTLSDPLTVPAGTTPIDSYDAAVLASDPALYLAMNSASSGKENDLSGHHLTGTYKGGTPTSASLPNNDSAADFNGSSQYLTVPNSASLSIPTTGKLTWEAWIRPDTLSFSNASSDGYVDWMGKCENYSPSCEWEARMYGSSTSENRPNRLSAYVFNPSAGLGSAADWQPSSGSIVSGRWIHVVAEYDTTQTPSQCSSKYPGTINIWVNGVKQSFADHAPTGCMSQYSISPKSGNSPVNIGTMALDTWFKGGIGKVAIYDRLLSQSEINNHFTAMTGAQSSGSCSSVCTITPLSSLLK